MAPPASSHSSVASRQIGRVEADRPERADADMEESASYAQAAPVVFESAGDSHSPSHMISLAAAIVVFVSVLVQPLIFAHVSGLHTLGVCLPPNIGRPAAMKRVQNFVSSCVGGSPAFAFLVGVYEGGAKLFAAPIDIAPEEKAACRSSAQRRRAFRAGAAFLWCTLTALAGTACHDIAARSVLATQAFVKPIEMLADSARWTGTGEPISFHTGRVLFTSLIERPLLDSEQSPTAWKALSRATVSDALQQLLLSSSGGVLGEWAEVIRPLPINEIPPHLLEHIPDFSDHRLDKVPLPPVQ